MTRTSLRPVRSSPTARRLDPTPAAVAECDVASVAALLAEPARAAMVLAVLDGRARPAGELAHLARVSRATASGHLARLVAGGCLDVERVGRHRYFRLASPAVARAVEALALVAPAPRGPAPGAPGAGLQLARSCYDHLAGWLAVRVTDALVARGALALDERGFQPGEHAATTFAALGVDLDDVRARARVARRPLARPCLDWSERRPHVAGALGTALLRALLERGWLERLARGRALRVTAAGRRGLLAALDVRVSDALIAGARVADEADAPGR